MQKTEKPFLLTVIMNEFLKNLSVYSVLLPFLTGLILWKFQDANARIMFVLLVFASFSQIGGKYLPVEENIRYNLYTIADALFWSLLFYRNTIGRNARVIIFTLYTGLIIYASISYFSFGIQKVFFAEVVCLNNIIQVICVLIYFYERYNNEKMVRLADDSMFWFSLAILFYAPCTYFMFAYLNFFGKSEQLWKYHNILNTLLYFIITIGLLVRVKKVKTHLQWT